MGYGRCVGGVGALAVATRMTVSIGVAVLVVMATAVPAPTVSPAVKARRPSSRLDRLDPGRDQPSRRPTTSTSTSVRNHFIAPTHPGQDIEYVAVTAPKEAWPVTGVGRLVWLALGPPSVWGPGGPAWPDEPWWKLSGLFDLTFDQSVQAGVADLEQAMAAHGNDHLVIYGYSQGAMIAIREKRKLAEQYPAGTKAPDIDFVLSGDLNLPNGGLLARFPGLYIPIIDLSFNGAEPTDTPFDTAVITRQYDGVADFPLYPLNVISLLNAVLGAIYVHPYTSTSAWLPIRRSRPLYQGTHGDTSYYFFETEDLPLFAPLRTLGVPEPVIDVVEPFFKVIVDLGYDRSIKPWEPTPARLIPPLNPVTVAGDLVNAIGEGIDNAAALIGLPPLPSIPAARAEITTADDTDETAMRQQATDTDADGNAAAGHRHRPDGNAAAGHRHRPDGNAAAGHRHRQTAMRSRPPTPTRGQRPPFRHPSRGSVPRGTRRRASWFAVRSGCTANRAADGRTPAMQTRQPPRPRLPAMWPRPREPLRQNRHRETVPQAPGRLTATPTIPKQPARIRLSITVPHSAFRMTIGYITSTTSERHCRASDYGYGLDVSGGSRTESGGLRNSRVFSADLAVSFHSAKATVAER